METPVTLTRDNVGFNFGLEQEFFVSNVDKQFVLPPQEAPRDNAGYLVEARGKPYTDITDAAYSLEASVHRINKILSKDSLYIVGVAREKLSERLKLEAYRKYGLPLKDKLIANLYDNSLTDEQLEWQYAGIHVNISKVIVIFGNNGMQYMKTEAFDHVPIIKWLDKCFEQEIIESQRLKGSYAIKELEGGFGLEYRSLPTTVNRITLMSSLLRMKEELKLY